MSLKRLNVIEVEKKGSNELICEVIQLYIVKDSEINTNSLFEEKVLFLELIKMILFSFL